MRWSSLAVGAIVLLAPALGGAEPRDLVVSGTTIDDLVLARQALPPAHRELTGLPALAQSRLVYLNKNGVTLTPGANDSISNRSSLATAQTTIPAWSTTPQTWAATVACIKELFNPFDIAFTETDPGNVPHIEAVFGGSPLALNMSTTFAGVSPFTSDCAIIENAIVFTFTAVLPSNDARLACEIQAQEIAHAFGLDHEMLAIDPMTYLAFDGNRSFQNRVASCGEDKSRPCGINGSTCRADQNSVALLYDRLGAKSTPGDAVPPQIAIDAPANNATVEPGFTIGVRAADANGVKMVTLFVDGVPMGSASVAPFAIKAPTSLAEGKHRLRLEASDGANKQFQEIAVTIRKTTAGGGSAGTDDGDGDDVLGGCSAAGGGAGWLLGLLALVLRRRR